MDELGQQENAAESNRSFRHGSAERHTQQSDQLQAILQDVVEPNVVFSVKVIRHCKTDQP